MSSNWLGSWTFNPENVGSTPIISAKSQSEVKAIQTFLGPMLRSSRGLGYDPFTVGTRVRISYGVPNLWVSDRLVMYLPLKQSDVGSIPTAPTKYAGLTERLCSRLLS